jgi:hypothetical protein
LAVVVVGSMVAVLLLLLCSSAGMDSRWFGVGIVMVVGVGTEGVAAAEGRTGWALGFGGLECASWCFVGVVQALRVSDLVGVARVVAQSALSYLRGQAGDVRFAARVFGRDRMRLLSEY